MSSSPTRLELPDAEVLHLPGFLSPGQADDLLAALLTDLAWEQHVIRLFGREV